MTVKEKGRETISFPYYQSNGGTMSYGSFVSGPDRISYEDGRRVRGHWPWKSCTHTWEKRDPRGGIQICRSVNRRTLNVRSFYGCNTTSALATPSPVNSGFDEDAVRGILNQIDLNKGESTLLYSGILQAVPLVGGALKFTSLMNKIAKKFRKDFLRKPFTTVVKTAISMDFIDRFVVSPTIDDARRFLDATNYVVNVVNTAQQRSATPTALRTGVKTVHKDTAKTISSYGNFGGAAKLGGTNRNYTYEESQCFALLVLRYAVDATTPIKLWMRRTGITRPLDSVWDLVPFSFVIDYFTRAGDFISALSDEMSDVDGLKGTILSIEDLWETHKYESRSWIAGNHWVNDAIPVPTTGDWNLVENSKLALEPYWSKGGFTRYRMHNPWYHLLSAQERLSDYLSINLDLSSTRKRTIAELVIQAKL